MGEGFGRWVSGRWTLSESALEWEKKEVDRQVQVQQSSGSGFQGLVKICEIEVKFDMGCNILLYAYSHTI